MKSLKIYFIKQNLISKIFNINESIKSIILELYLNFIFFKMALEIERKFLVNSDEFKSLAKKELSITQGFLSIDKNAVVRVRIQDELAFITIKGISNKSGTTRYEWEKAIDLDEAKDLLLLCKARPLLKTRFLVNFKNHTFEVDEFYDSNAGLIIAEIELNNTDEYFEKPKWLGKEVTGNLKYYNVMLAQHPFKTWNQ